MSGLQNLSSRSLTLAFGIVIGTIAPLITAIPEIGIIAPAAAQTTFPDVPQNYWARPFIESLTARNIIAGYPDGTFRPEQLVKRDEFAALIRKAFNEERVRSIPSGSAFNDVPEGYWADPAIKEAYETGFLNKANGNNFRPRDEITRAQALATLVRGLNLAPTRTQATTTNKARANRRPIYFPVAIASLMQPAIQAVNQAVAAPSNPPQKVAAVGSAQSPTAIVREYYTDAEQIPEYAVEDVAKATQENIVVNYPNVRVLNPNQPLNRATAAAWVHQALVREGRIPPLTNNAAANYIVGRSN